VRCPIFQAYVVYCRGDVLESLVRGWSRCWTISFVVEDFRPSYLWCGSSRTGFLHLSLLPLERGIPGWSGRPDHLFAEEYSSTWALRLVIWYIR